MPLLSWCYKPDQLALQRLMHASALEAQSPEIFLPHARKLVIVNHNPYDADFKSSRSRDLNLSRVVSTDLQNNDIISLSFILQAFYHAFDIETIGACSLLQSLVSFSQINRWLTHVASEDHTC